MSGALSLLKRLGKTWAELVDKNPEAYRLGAPNQVPGAARFATEDTPIDIRSLPNRKGQPRDVGQRVWQVAAPGKIRRRGVTPPVLKVKGENMPMDDRMWAELLQTLPLEAQLRVAPKIKVSELEGYASEPDDELRALHENEDNTYSTATIDSMDAGARGSSEVNPRLYYTAWDLLDSLGLPDRGVTGLTRVNQGRKPALLHSYGLRSPERAKNVELNPNMFGMEEYNNAPYSAASIYDPDWHNTTKKDALRDSVMGLRAFVEEGRRGLEPATQWRRAGQGLSADTRTGVLAAAEPMKLRGVFGEGFERSRWALDQPRFDAGDTDMTDPALGIGASSVERALLSDWLIRRLDAGLDVDPTDPMLKKFLRGKLYAHGGRVKPLGGLKECNCHE